MSRGVVAIPRGGGSLRSPVASGGVLEVVSRVENEEKLHRNTTTANTVIHDKDETVIVHTGELNGFSHAL